MNEKRMLVDSKSRDLSISRQCELLELPRSTFYYACCRDNSLNLKMMRLIDEVYTERPFYGSRRICIELRRAGFDVGRDAVRALMRKMGIEAIYAKPNLSKAYSDHKIYPYLLRNIAVSRKDQVWSTDITYIRMESGFLYLTAVIDWHCRYILSWRLSNSLDGTFCREALKEALDRSKPEIFNTDQGCQYTSPEFTNILKNEGIQISMDGRGRALDNVFIERFWRTVKQEEVYLRDYVDGLDAYKSLEKYINFYNEDRPHSSLGYISPGEMYRNEKKSR